MNQNTRARGGKNGGPGVLPLAVEASFFLDFLDTFSSRKKYQILIAKGKKQIFIECFNLSRFFPLMPAGASPFSLAKKDHAEAERRDHEYL
jgi:hypothetical protein